MTKPLGQELGNWGSSLGFGDSGGKESSCEAGDLGSTPGLGRSPGEGNSYPLQYSGLENSIHGATKSRTQLSDFHLPLTGFVTLKQVF